MAAILKPKFYVKGLLLFPLSFGVWSIWLCGYFNIFVAASCLLAFFTNFLLLQHLRKSPRRKATPSPSSESDELYKQIINQASDIIYKSDTTGRFTFVNHTAVRILGYSEKEINGLHYLDLIHPAYRQTANDFYKQQFIEKTPSSYYEFPAIAKDGTEVWLGQSAQLITEGARIVGFQAVARDITERKRAEEAAHQAEEYRNLFRLANDAILIYDPEGAIILDVNDKACEVYRLSRAELIGSSLKERSPDPEAQERELMKLLAEGSYQKFETVQLQGDGTPIHFHISASVIDYRGRKAILCINRDITEHKQAQEALRRSEEQLRQSQKMESIGTLAGGVAHDFNNILAAIQLNAQMALNARPGERVERRLTEIEKAGNRAAALTRQLLAFSRRQRLERRTLNLNDVIDDLLRMLRRIIGEDIEARFHTAADLHQVFADPAQIEQVVMNLAVNARDAMPGGGVMQIETQNVELGEAFCRTHTYAKPGKYVKITVSDTGVGIAAEVRERIFEPFFTTKELGRGTGLGLAMVYGIVKQHDGLIEVRSDPGRGTTFEIYLPIDERIAPEEIREIAPALQRGDETILLAEDEEVLREVARDILETLGYRILLAGDGEEAVELFAANRHRIDAVILDVVMPRMNGHAAYERIRSLDGNVPVIFTTGYSAEMVESNFVEQSEIIAESGSVVIQKPYKIETLGHKLREVLDGSLAKEQTSLKFA
jgi:two-component system, cell cycle sensor histidine kinase and response regulator CckA